MQQSSLMTTLARARRQTVSSAESVLWQALRNRRLNGMKFRRQSPVGLYICDFLCLEARLAIEIVPRDELDEAKAYGHAVLMAQGYTVLRFARHDILNNLSGVLYVIGRDRTPAPAVNG